MLTEKGNNTRFELLYSYSVNQLDDPENTIAENNAYMPGF